MAEIDGGGNANRFGWAPGRPIADNRSMGDEQVLVIPVAALDRFTGFRPASVGDLARLLDPARLQFRPRAEVETDPRWLQLIPYVVLTCGGDAFHYTRGSGGGEARLRAKRSVGLGGHINPVDGDGGDAYRAGLERELREEVAIDSPFTEELLGLIFDPSTPVGEVHLGVVHRLRLARPAVMPREGGIADAGFAPVAELRRDRAAFETWSQIALDAIDDS